MWWVGGWPGGFHPNNQITLLPNLHAQDKQHFNSSWNCKLGPSVAKAFLCIFEGVSQEKNFSIFHIDIKYNILPSRQTCWCGKRWTCFWWSSQPRRASWVHIWDCQIRCKVTLFSSIGGNTFSGALVPRQYTHVKNKNKIEPERLWSVSSGHMIQFRDRKDTSCFHQLNWAQFSL